MRRDHRYDRVANGGRTKAEPGRNGKKVDIGKKNWPGRTSPARHERRRLSPDLGLSSRCDLWRGGGPTPDIQLDSVSAVKNKFSLPGPGIASGLARMTHLGCRLGWRLRFL